MRENMIIKGHAVTIKNSMLYFYLPLEGDKSWLGCSKSPFMICMSNFHHTPETINYK
jgi:hypothetical protein